MYLTENAVPEGMTAFDQVRIKLSEHANCVATSLLMSLWNRLLLGDYLVFGIVFFLHARWSYVF